MFATASDLCNEIILSDNSCLRSFALRCAKKHERQDDDLQKECCGFQAQLVPNAHAQIRLEECNWSMLEVHGMGR